MTDLVMLYNFFINFFIFSKKPQAAPAPRRSKAEKNSSKISTIFARCDKIYIIVSPRSSAGHLR